MASLVGKFRNAEFFIDGHDLSGGRRVALHEYPLRDVPYAEDLGRKARTWSIEAFTLADNASARDALIAALEEAGPGTLAHPYLGTLRAVVQDFRVAESTSAARIARFSITFAEAGERAEPSATQDTASSLVAAATGAKTASEASFARAFNVTGLPSHVNDRAFADVGALIATAADWRRAISMPTSEASSFAKTLSGFASGLTVLLGTPGSLAAQVGGIFTLLSAAASTPMAAVRGLAGARDYQRAAVLPTAIAPARAQAVANTRAVHELTRRAALIESASAVAALRFGVGDAAASRADAQALRDALADQLDIEADSADDTTYQSLIALRTALVRHVTARAVALPNAATVTPKATLPALVIAHQIHGDASRAGEIVDRNHIRHPGFVTGGSALEVLHG